MTMRKLSLLAATGALGAVASLLVAGPKADAGTLGVTRAATMGCGVFAPVVRPHQFILACADGNDLLIDVKWSQWSDNSALGSAENSYNSCKPDCASSRTWITTEAEARLSFVVPTTSGRLFRTLSWRDVESQSCTTAGWRHIPGVNEQRA